MSQVEALLHYGARYITEHATFRVLFLLFIPPQNSEAEHSRVAHVSRFCVAHSQALTQADAATAAQRRTAGVAVAVERTQAAAGVEVDAAIEAALHGRCSPKRPRQRERPAHRSAAEALRTRAAAAGSRDASSPALPHHAAADDQSGVMIALMSPAHVVPSEQCCLCVCCR